MSENVDNAALGQLRIIREGREQSGRRSEALDAKTSSGFAHVQEELERIDGPIVMVGDVAMPIARTGARLDSMDERMGRLEQRND
jgi:hypothetical protein